MARQPVALGFTQGRSPPLTAARLINLDQEPAALTSRAPRFAAGPLNTVGGPSYGTPGLKSFATAGGADVRCGRFALGYLYILSGASLYQISQGGMATLCTGSAIPSIGPAMMTDNGVQLTILSGGSCFTVVGTVISKITASAYPAAGVSSIDTIDGYTIFSTSVGGSATYGTAKTITGATQANPCVITATGHGFTSNQQIFIQSVGGMTQLNNRSFSVLVVDANSFQLIGVDSTGYTAYTAGGTASPVISQAQGQWFISALYDSATINALQFATAESKPDPLLRVMVINRELWLFGSASIEPWQDSGASPFPFTRITGAVMDRGTAAALSPANLTGTAFWLGDDRGRLRHDLLAGRS